MRAFVIHLFDKALYVLLIVSVLSIFVNVGKLEDK